MNAFVIRFAEARKGVTGSQFFVELPSMERKRMVEVHKKNKFSC